MLERLFENFLWSSRWIVLLAVVFSLASAFGLFYMTTVDVIATLSHLTHYLELDEAARLELRTNTVGHVVASVDGYLLGIIMLIFALGLYELFISEIDPAQHSSNSSNILLINSLDDLKDRLAKVILMILVVIFFERAIHLNPKDMLELLYMGLGILMVSLALYFAHKAYHTDSPSGDSHQDKH